MAENIYTMRYIFKILTALIIAFLFLSEPVSASGFRKVISTVDTIPAKSIDSVIFERTAVPPTVSKDAWDAHLKKTLKIVYNGVRKKMPAGSYTVQVRFLVERDGSISQAMALSDPGFKLAECAVIIIKTGPRWNPGEYNGNKVRSYHHQSITFEISE